MTTSGKKVILSGATPSAQLTLGNYLGALKQWVALQRQYDCLFMVANMHAITVRQDPKELRERTYQAAANYLAAGLDPESVFLQSDVPQHAELTWVLQCFAYMGELNRMTQFKDKSQKQGQNIPAGLFTYPTLMAADILLYQTDLVPVGEDQKQHIELTRDLAERLRNLFGEDVFRMPEPFIPPVGARVMSLQNPQAKMSKSDPDPNAVIYLSDSDDAIVKKLKRAVTDSGTEVTYEDSKPGVKNLIAIQAAITGKSPEAIVAEYAGKMYGHLKVGTAEIVVECVRPLRTRAQELLADRAALDAILRRAGERARARAEATVRRVYDRVGFVSTLR
jgi:tryptophanyl-tRNA synthetase